MSSNNFLIFLIVLILLLYILIINEQFWLKDLIYYIRVVQNPTINNIIIQYIKIILTIH